MSNLTGRPLGSRYVLLDQIGGGGMGTVWRARARDTGELVAIKLLREELTNDPGIVTRFVQERTVLLRLRHPNIVTVRDFVLEGDQIALVMDLVEGSDLRGLLGRRGSLPPSEAAGLLAQVADALAVAHQSGVVHRDLKPGNVLLDTSSGPAPVPRLTDFGVARIVDGPGVTVTTSVIGTPDYMAPELAEGRVPTPAVDVYAAGIMLYELLAGRTPYSGGHPVGVLSRHLDHMPRRLPGMPDALWQVITACVAKDPAHRPAAAWLAQALRAAEPALAGLPALPPLPRHGDPDATSEPLPGGLPRMAPPSGAVPASGPAPGAALGAAPAATPVPDPGSTPRPGTVAVSAYRFGQPESSAPPLPAEPARSARRGRPVLLGGAVAACLAALLVVPFAAGWRPFGGEQATGGIGGNQAAGAGPELGDSDAAISDPTALGTTEPDSPSPTPTRSRTPRPTATKRTPSATPRPSSSPKPRPQPLAWKCRGGWKEAGPDVFMDPCIATRDGKIYIMGKLKAPAGTAADIFVSLYDSNVNRDVGSPRVCGNVVFEYDGQVKTCGPFATTAPHGYEYVSRIRWRPTGSGQQPGGGAESAPIQW